MENTKEIKDLKPIAGEKISRKAALQKATLIGLSAATMMLLLNNPAKSQSSESPAEAPEWPPV